MKIVLDSNVLISALIQARGPSSLLLDAWMDGAFELVTSAFQLAEVQDVLARPRIQKRVMPAEAEMLLDILASQSLVMPLTAMEVHFSRDPADNAIIASAIAAGADFIVSGDKAHMLILGSAAGIQIITPREAVIRLGLS